MNSLQQFLDEGIKINVQIDKESAATAAGYLSLGLFLALVLALFIYSKIK